MTTKSNTWRQLDFLLIGVDLTLTWPKSGAWTLCPQNTAPPLADFRIPLQILSCMLSFSYYCFGCNKCSQLLLILLNCCSWKVTGWFSVHSHGDLAKPASSWVDVNIWIVSSCMHPTFPVPISTKGLSCPSLVAEISLRAEGTFCILILGNKVNRKVVAEGRQRGKVISWFFPLCGRRKEDQDSGHLGLTYSSAPPFLGDISLVTCCLWASIWTSVSSHVRREAGQGFWVYRTQVGMKFSRLWPAHA